MVLCLFHVSIIMNRLSPVTGILTSCPCSFKLHNRDSKLVGCGFYLQRKERFKRKLKFVVSAELSRSFSVNLGLDSKKIGQSHDPSQLPWIGPVPGDIAEVEAYCRIFRAAEQLHAALMDTLCNPLTGECKISYDFTPEEKPLLEDKIVSVLGCILSLLNKGREDVLSGRSSIMSSFRDAEVSAMEDKLPPLAIFRSEMKRCCESLHVALENYLTPDYDRSLDVWRKLQRLKNVCYDSGFPRLDDCPCHMLFANWNAVYLSTSKEDLMSKNSEAAFWRGGQVTEEGLKWLLERGFKTILDLRAEIIKDNLYEAEVADAIAAGKVELIKIPVEVRTAPSMDQVEKFASLVSDFSKKPIYLHSKEGVWRTSAMVSRWRQYMTRSASQITTQRDVGSRQGPSIILRGGSLSGQENGSLPEALDKDHGSNGASNEVVSPKDENGQIINGGYNGHASVQGSIPLEMVDNGVGFSANISLEADPLKAQVPPCDFFSKAEMSRFFRTKKITPPTYSKYQLKGFEKLLVSRTTGVATVPKVDGIDPELGFVEAKRSYGLVSGKNASPKPQSSPADSDKHLNGCSNTSAGSGNGVVSSASSDDGMCTIEGNMCASATGVVRVQSRRKAEMFLVRTDGFSCTREQVTESSLAFTHPSTQQQMLMWKTTPKTVLLLKKLGKELMEEAKEVAYFLYHQEKMNVLVEPDVHDIFARIPGFGFVQTFYSQDTSDLHERVDFVACLGGDGVILHASNLFRGAVPPVVSFNLGSLGFLTSHYFEDYRQDLRQVIHGNKTLDGVYITLRMRLRCEIFRNGKAVPGKVFDVLNEMVVDRGSNPYLSKIECYEHDRLITKVQGDGVIVATPTGSTAYSTAAGGSMVHPNVPCMLFTPICPHSLSFRPVILPDSARLELKIPEDARSNAWVSFDGKRRQQLSRGDSVRISMSQHPLPTVNKSDQTGDWFHSLIRCLNWNERLDQKAL
ncbi:PREDICTED: NAD kinase 2, chloroplastic-like isoform X3 [Populus euphratica]|uniref:NAD(+) kinase n=1 Tax=Populus euphratica TaxID=75702 RepID=A0AAJ6T188_POPEU|nr:PREDICTED: NAD kinase 2, chloroplastic-like isoform X3 [Populus euphratica]